MFCSSDLQTWTMTSPIVTFLLQLSVFCLGSQFDHVYSTEVLQHHFLHLLLVLYSSLSPVRLIFGLFITGRCIHFSLLSWSTGCRAGSCLVRLTCAARSGCNWLNLKPFHCPLTWPLRTSRSEQIIWHHQWRKNVNGPGLHRSMHCLTCITHFINRNCSYE